MALSSKVRSLEKNSSDFWRKLNPLLDGNSPEKKLLLNLWIEKMKQYLKSQDLEARHFGFQELSKLYFFDSSLSKEFSNSYLAAGLNEKKIILSKINSFILLHNVFYDLKSLLYIDDLSLHVRLFSEA